MTISPRASLRSLIISLIFMALIVPAQTFAASLRIAIPFGFSGPNPDPAISWNGWRTSDAGITETLLWLNPDMELEPRLAESAELLAPTTWEIVLRNDVLFHDGSPLTAEAVRFSFERVIDPESPVYNERIAFLTNIAAIDVVDSQTVRIETQAPNAAFLNDLVDPGLAIVSLNTTEDRFYGTGPFVLERVVPGERIDVVRFADYWGGAAGVERAALLTITDPATVMLALESGDIDIAANFPDTDIERIAQRDDLAFAAVPTGRVMFFFLQVNSGPLADLRVRQALDLLVPRDEIVATVLYSEGGDPGIGIFRPTAPWASPELQPIDYDPETALALLREAGFTDSNGDGLLDQGGTPLTLNIRSYHGRPSMQPAAELYLDHLRRHGITAHLRVLRDWTVAVDDFRSGRADMLMFSSNSAPTGNPLYFPNSTFRSDAAENYGRWSNSEFDTLLSEALVTFDAEQRQAKVNRMQSIIREELPVTIAFYKSRLAVWHTHVQGFQPHPAEIYLMSNTLGVAP